MGDVLPFSDVISSTLHRLHYHESLFFQQPCDEVQIIYPWYSPYSPTYPNPQETVSCASGVYAYVD